MLGEDEIPSNRSATMAAYPHQCTRQLIAQEQTGARHGRLGEVSCVTV